MEVLLQLCNLNVNVTSLADGCYWAGTGASWLQQKGPFVYSISGEEKFNYGTKSPVFATGVSNPKFEMDSQNVTGLPATLTKWTLRYINQYGRIEMLMTM